MKLDDFRIKQNGWILTGVFVFIFVFFSGLFGSIYDTRLV